MQHVELLTGRADTRCHFRLLRGKGVGRNLSGMLADLWPDIEARQHEGWQVFVVVNDGGHTRHEIVRVRALFVDGDGIAAPRAWHAEPDFIVRRDATHWHAYWLVTDLPTGEFKDAQRRLAAHYGTDPKVCDLPRIMRLAGSLHLKNPAAPKLVTIEAVCRRSNVRTAAALLAELPAVTVAAHRIGAVPNGEPVSLDLLRSMLARLDPGCDRNEWRDIVAATRAAPVPGDGDESGRRQLAHEWSAGDLAGGEPQNYTGTDDVDDVFDSMAPVEPGKPGIHFGSLVVRARAAGYDGPISVKEAETHKRWYEAVQKGAADEAQLEIEEAFSKEIIKASAGAIRPMPPPAARPASPEFTEKATAIVAEEKRRGEELARQWGLL